ncbi:MAG: AAA family ATPase, partial [Oscillospiraceae bacterium]|nr:AAA family ATPase [Oscillospiraceae bacterium]
STYQHHRRSFTEKLSHIQVSLSNAMSREMILKEYIDSVRDEYSYILIDCMPSLGIMTINALVAADSVISFILLHFQTLVKVKLPAAPVPLFCRHVSSFQA